MFFRPIELDLDASRVWRKREANEQGLKSEYINKENYPKKKLGHHREEEEKKIFFVC